MSARTRFTAAEVIAARDTLLHFSTDEMLARGFINIPSVLGLDKRFDVVLISTNPDRKIKTLKAIREVIRCDLLTAKQLVESPQSVILRSVNERTANDAYELLQESGSQFIVRES